MPNLNGKEKWSLFGGDKSESETYLEGLSSHLNDMVYGEKPKPIEPAEIAKQELKKKRR